MNVSRENNRGITLIALVVTVIVLLIILSISVAKITGDNGLIAQARRAKYEANQADILEKIELAEIAARRKNDGQLDINKFEEELRNEFGEDVDIIVTPNEDNGTCDIEVEGIITTVPIDDTDSMAEIPGGGSGSGSGGTGEGNVRINVDEKPTITRVENSNSLLKVTLPNYDDVIGEKAIYEMFIKEGQDVTIDIDEDNEEIIGGTKRNNEVYFYAVNLKNYTYYTVLVVAETITGNQYIWETETERTYCKTSEICTRLYNNRSSCLVCGGDGVLEGQPCPADNIQETTARCTWSEYLRKYGLGYPV